jgi:hypothetical protein
VGESLRIKTRFRRAFILSPLRVFAFLHSQEPKRTFSGGYSCAGFDRSRHHVPSHQYSPAVISPASGNITVNGSEAQRTKTVKKLSVGGPESGPLLFHSINVAGTNTVAPRASPTQQADLEARDWPPQRE